jgi:hypothetical protein
MYFTEWLLKRWFNMFFGGTRWTWVSKYREIIMEERALSILLTALLGTIWFMVSFSLCMVFSQTRPSDLVAYALLAVPLLFYIYNWMMALYEIFDDERRRTWQTLKEEQ